MKILFTDDEYVQSSEELFREMVRETNRMVVDQEEVLSDNVGISLRQRER